MDFSRIHRIVIVLGHKCNLACKYCIQSEIHNDISLEQEINPIIYSFIEKILQQSVQLNDSNKLMITFIGGEPLIYFNKIKEIINECTKRQFNVKYQILTNGVLLNNETVNYINEHNILVCLSYDGRHSIETRGYDPIQSNINNIIKINDLFILSVVSPITDIEETIEDWDFIYNKYIALHNKSPRGFKLSPIRNNDHINITDNDLQILKSKSKKIIDKYYTGTLSPAGINFITESGIKRLRRFALSGFNLQKRKTRCGMGTYLISISIDGKLLACHQYNEIIGNINTLINNSNSYNNYIKNKHLELGSINNCNKCKAASFCTHGCIMQSKKGQELDCKVIKALFEPFYDKMILHIEEILREI